MTITKFDRSGFFTRNSILVCGSTKRWDQGVIDVRGKVGFNLKFFSSDLWLVYYRWDSVRDLPAANMVPKFYHDEERHYSILTSCYFA